MARLAVGGLVREIDVIVLDKDGTLIDFHKAWGGRLVRGVRSIRRLAGGDATLEAALFRTLGGNPGDGSVLPDGPYVSASIADTGLMAATVLYQSGVDWHRSLAIVAETLLPVLTAPPQAEEIQGIGDVRRTLQRLKASGLRLAVATNDERPTTLAGLARLEIDDLIDAIVCAGDPGLAAKPSPDGLVHIARTFDVPASRLAMVGDSAGDMITGRAAGVGVNVGVLSGPGTADSLAPHADIIVADIHALGVI